ncbi:MAG: hypothetical protein ABI193_07325 [Minicystis sp.]
MKTRLVWIGLLLLAGCAPDPKSVRCGNGGDCEKMSSRFHYCLQSRCVECVGDPECGEGRACLDGACGCTADRSCGAGQRCEAGACKSP